jgi:non-ribosomal peptide synthetase component F
MSTSFVEHYRALVLQQLDAAAVTFGEVTLDRSELPRRSEAVAHHLLSLGVEEGDYVHRAAKWR